MDIFWYKFLISLFLSIGLILLRFFQEVVLKRINIQFFSHFLLTFLVFRIIPFFIVYIVFDFDTTSDVNIFYSSALSAIHGGIVYRDFVSVYSPLFPYFSGILLYVWNSPKAIVLMMLIVESISLWGTIKLFKHQKVTLWAFVYYLLPTSFVFSILGGQEDVWMWGGLVATLHLFQKFKHTIWLGIGMALALLISKLIFILILPGFFVLVKNRIQFFLGFVLVFIPIIAVLFNIVGWELLAPINEANIPRTPNLISLIRPFFNGNLPLGLPIFNWLGLIINLILGLLWIMIRWNKTSFNQSVIELFVGTNVLLMLLQQSSYANYAFLFIMPIVFFYLEDLNRFEWFYFVVLNIVLVIQPALWWHNGLFYINYLNDLRNPLYATEYLFGLFIIVGLIGLLSKLIQKNASYAMSFEQKLF